MSAPRAHRTHAAAIATAALISAAYVVAPVYETSGGSETLIEANGAWTIALLLLPPLVAALPLLATPPARRAAIRGAAAVLTVFALLSGFTIGIPYLLPAALLWAAGLAGGRQA